MLYNNKLSPLVPNGGIPRALLWMLAILSGVTVANIYYSQPLLNMISDALHVSHLTANMIPMCAQIGYALGLLFIIPLGDLYSRRKLVFTSLVVLVVSLLVVATSSNIHVILGISIVIGACSVIPQVFMPIASQYSRPDRKTRNMGILLSGLLAGILGSRVISGIVGEYFGWRAIYWVASVLMIVCIVAVWSMMPEMPVNFKGTYQQLMKTVFSLLRHNSTLQLVSVRASLCFGSFFSLWSTLAFKMSSKPFYAGNDMIGMLGLCGFAGAITASFVGKYIHIYGIRRFQYLGSGCVCLSWVVMYLFQNAYVGIIAGIIVLDMGMQCVQLSNQSCALSLVPKASNRVNTVFMTTFFLGGSLGTFLSGICWNFYGWGGVSACSILLALISISLTVFTKH